MGESGSFNLAKRKLWNWISLMMVLLSLLFQPAYCQQCRIQRCNSEYVASTSPSGGGGLGDEGGLAAGAGTGGGGGSEVAVDYCTALRAYSLCTRRTSRGCHGDLTYHAALLSIRELFSQHNCSSDGPTSPAKAPGSDGSGGTKRPGGGGGGAAPVVPQLCDYESRVLAQGPAGRHKKYAHCGLFGDPHLRTFRDEFQTCKVEGAWPLIDNRYLSVQVTNVPVVQGSSATATSKITVIFKAYEGCTEQKVYQATTEDLPSAFQDGTRGSGRVGSGGGGAGAETAASSSLWISEQSGGPGGRLVRLQARHIGTSIIVRRVGRYLTFAIRMPEDALEPSEDSESGGLQLCLRGCPRNELIQEHTLHHQAGLPNGNVPAHAGLPPPPPPHQAYSVERATTKCRETLQVEDVYFQSCVFDLLTTGDPEFSMAAFGALEDLKALPPSRLKQTPPWTPTDDNNNVPDARGSKLDSGVGNSARESQATTTHTVLLVTLIVALLLV